MNWFSGPVAAFERWRAMFELRSLQKRETSDFRWEFKGMIAEAHDVLERGNRQRAIEIWNRAHAMFADLAMLSYPTLDLLMRLRLFDEAEELMRQGCARFPTEAHPSEGLALLAYRRGHLEEAICRCEVLRKKYPASVTGYGVAAACLSEAGRDKEAEAILLRGVSARPEDVGLRLEYARIAERRRDWDEALKRWGVVLETYGHGSGAIGIANALTETGRHDEADKTLKDVLYKWGNDLNIWFAFVKVAQHRQDWEEVARRWAMIRKRFPMEPVVYTHGLGDLLRTSRPEAADEVLREGMEQLPFEPDIWIEYARLAHRRNEWEEAAKRWAAVREHFPVRPEGFDRGADALAAAGKSEEASAVRAMKP
jgi:tetratricopeptide (TPR) repeat protein